MPYTSCSCKTDTRLYYEDYGSGQPVVLIHGWPLSHRMWDDQISALVEAGYRVIAYDRRGFGKSDKPWDGYDYDTLADDLHRLIEQLDLKDTVLVGFSMGGGEVARYVGSHGTSRLAKIILVGAVTPFMLRTDDNPDGVDGEVFDGIKAGIAGDLPGFFGSFGESFTSYENNKDRISKDQLHLNQMIACSASKKAVLDCVDSFGRTDFRDDLRKVDVPCLIIHGDDDQTVPLEVSGQKAHKITPNSELKVIKGAPHGLNFTHPKELNAALLEFLKK